MVPSEARRDRPRDDGPLLAPLTPHEEEERARALALRALAGAPRTRSQLEERLAAADVDETLSTALLDRFEDVGLIDDAAYARAVVRTRFAERHQARRAIAQELSRKGISAEHAHDALTQITSDDEKRAADEVARTRVRRTRGLPVEVRTRRALAALGRKGYPPGVALASVRAALADEVGSADAGVPEYLDDLDASSGD